MKRNRFIIIGAGNIGRDLLEKLPKELDLLCIDNAPDAEERIRKIRGENAVVLIGDATSRLVLEKAEVNEAETVLITTTTEKVNVEVARVLKEHFQPKRVISVGITTDGIRKIEESGVEVLDIFATSAASFRNMLEQKTKTAHSIGLGKIEILEVEVHPHSRLANKRLRSLAPIRWRIGIIYRDGNIIIPHGDTVLKPKDRVVILGDPGVLKTVSEILTFSFEQFPTEFGSSVIAYLAGSEDERYFAELAYLFSIFPLKKLVMVYSPRALPRYGELGKMVQQEKFKDVEERRIDLPLFEAVKAVVNAGGSDFGMVVLSASALAGGLLQRGRKRMLLDLTAAAACPILISRGTNPYSRVAVPAVAGLSQHHALETALEIAGSVNNEISALLVQPSKYIASDSDLKDFESSRKSITELSLMYKASVNTPVLQGNPVKAVIKALPGYNLLLIDTGSLKKGGRLSGLLNPDVLWHIVKRSTVSTLFIPPIEESL